jgi:fructose-specific phosphotransferase system component IIB
MEENRIPTRVSYTNLAQDELKQDGREGGWWRRVEGKGI